MNQQKRKDYEKSQIKKARRPCFKIADLSSSSSDCEYSNSIDNDLK